jgi:dolichyl-phosphate-mannose-protein mannosyltransferase
VTGAQARAARLERRRRLTASLLVPLAVVSLAAGVRLWHLSSPAGTYFDESYYALDAQAYLGGGFGGSHPDDPAVKIENEGTWVHPPLGKWMIALLGEGPIGDRPFGWRFPSALFGIAGVLLLYLLALELWGSVWWAGLAALALALDGLHVVQSRMAMLDIFLTTFLTAGFLFVVLDRKRSRPSEAASGGTRLDRWFGSRYRLLAGVTFGAAVATKWSGLLGLALGAALSLWWTLGRAERGDRLRAIRAGALCFLAVPLVVYVASYTTFFIEHGPAVGDFLHLQKAMLLHNLHHRGVQAENSAPWTWPLLLHPIRYYPPQILPRPAGSPEILSLGNPVLWWGFLAALPLLAGRIIRSHQWQDVLIAGGYSAMFLPWLVLNRTQFFYYMLPAVPFMALGAVAGIRTLKTRWRGSAAVAFAVAALAAGFGYAPLWLYARVPAGWLEALPRLPGWG